VRSLSWRAMLPIFVLTLAGCVQPPTAQMHPAAGNQNPALGAAPAPELQATSLAAAPAKRSRTTKITDPAINAQIALLSRRPVAHINRRRELLVEARVVGQENAETLHLKPATGVILMEVMEGGAAELSGLQAGDVILRFSGLPVREIGDLTRALNSVSAGAQVRAEVWREGAEKSFLIRF